MKNKKKKTASGRKQSISKQEISYLRSKAEECIISAFANRKP